MAPRPRFERLDDEKKRRILDAAADEFAQRGYVEASYNQIIEAAGVSKGAMYYYFDDKLDLFCTVLEGVMEEMFKTPGSLHFDIKTRDEYWAIIDEHFRMITQMSLVKPRNVELGKVFMSLPLEMRDEPRIAKLFELGGRWVVELLDAGHSVGAIRRDIPTELLVKLIFAMDETLDRHFLPHFGSYSSEELEDVAGIYADLFRRTCELRETP